MAGGEGAAEGGGAVSVEARVKAALDPFGDPVEKSQLYAAAGSRPPRYYTFSCESFGDDYGDDEPGCERWLVSVHLFAPLTENCVARVRETKRALSAAGFTWPHCTDATGQDGQHYVLECETVDFIEEGGAEDGEAGS